MQFISPAVAPPAPSGWGNAGDELCTRSLPRSKLSLKSRPRCRIRILAPMWRFPSPVPGVTVFVFCLRCWSPVFGLSHRDGLFVNYLL